MPSSRLLGPSGCAGKSTTLNLIAGLDKPDNGTILLGDKDITQMPPNERRMAMVFQNYALYPNMTVFDNIAFSLEAPRKRPASRDHRARVTAVADMLDIGHLLNRKPLQLPSGGQQQRVALGRALVKEPLVFLLDEPFSNLDAALRSRMRTEVKHLHVRLGTTSIFVTHDQEEAMTLSDMICVMRDGKVVQFGTQADVYGKPMNTYVATFVGKPKMSLVDGTLDYRADEVDFVGPGIRIGLGKRAALGLRDGNWSDVALGVRAEDVNVVAQDATDKPGSFQASVQLLEPIGSDTFVELVVGPASIIARVSFWIALSARARSARPRGDDPGPDPPLRAGPGRAHQRVSATPARGPAPRRASDPIKVLVAYSMMVPLRERFEALGAGFDIEFRTLEDRASMDALEDPDLEVLIGLFPPRDRTRTPRLRWLQLASAGVDHLIAEAPWNHGLTVTNAAGVYGPAIGQYVLSAILRINEHIDARLALQLEHRWAEGALNDQLVGRPLRGQTAVIVGYGGVGREVAAAARRARHADRGRPESARSARGPQLSGCRERAIRRGTIPEQNRWTG